MNNCGLQGRYIPVFASAIYDKNAELAAAGVAPINLTSVMIGVCSAWRPLNEG